MKPLAEDILAAFYATQRPWSLPEQGAARSLIDYHRWTASRAAYIATWIRSSDFWSGKINSIVEVLRNIDKINSGAGTEVVHLARTHKDTPLEEIPPGRGAVRGQIDPEEWLAGKKFRTPEIEAQVRAQVARLAGGINAAMVRGVPGSQLAAAVGVKMPVRAMAAGIEQLARSLDDKRTEEERAQEAKRRRHVEPQHAGDQSPPRTPAPAIDDPMEVSDDDIPY